MTDSSVQQQQTTLAAHHVAIAGSCIPKGRQNAGLHLKQDSAVEYWGGIIYDLKKRFQHSTEHSTKVSSRACAAYACLPAERAPAASAARACAVRLPLLRSLPLRLLSVLATNWVTFACT